MFLSLSEDLLAVSIKNPCIATIMRSVKALGETVGVLARIVGLLWERQSWEMQSLECTADVRYQNFVPRQIRLLGQEDLYLGKSS